MSLSIFINSLGFWAYLRQFVNQGLHCNLLLLSSGLSCGLLEGMFCTVPDLFNHMLTLLTLGKLPCL